MTTSSDTQPTTVPSFVTRLLATGFFSGYIPVAPGTAGSLVALLLYLIPGFDSANVMGISIIVFFLIGVRVSHTMEKSYGDDPSIVVIDEVVGMWISLLLLPKTLALAAGAFLVFRAFDIVKPPPARQLESLRFGWGIMMDDVIAGLYANLTLRALIFLFPQIAL